MKKFYRVVFCLLLIFTLVSLFVVSSFAQSSYFDTFLSVFYMDSILLVYRNTQNNTISLKTLDLSPDMYVNLGNTFAIDLTEVISYPNDVDLSLYNFVNISFVFHEPLPSDYFTIQLIPGFVASATGAGSSLVNPGDFVNNAYYSLRNSVTHNDLVFDNYDTAAGSAQQISLIRNVERISLTLQSTSDDPNNGYQAFTLQDLVDSGPKLITFGTSFAYYAQAQSSNGYEDGFRDGKRDGMADVTDKVQQAFEDGKQSVLNSSYGNEQYNQGFEDGQVIGEASGYQDGYHDGVAAKEGFNLSMIPEAYIGTAYNYIVCLFNYDLFGWNLLAILGALMVVIVAGFILKKVL